MAKQGMKRPEKNNCQAKNSSAPVPEIQGKAKSGKKRARAIIAGTDSENQKVYHTVPFEKKQMQERPISDAYSVIDNDLARDNLENDITAADLQDL
ncbi:MAG: hypothetical protein NC397_06045 [Clostridium sp.]|nr:hypothetical protein [Clostridium sp.]